MRKILFGLILVTLTIFGCQTGGVDQAPPSPVEAKILAQTIMSVAIKSEDLNERQLVKLNTIFMGVRGVMMGTLSESPTELQSVTQTYLNQLDPAYQDLAEGVVLILLLRLQPYIDRGDSDLILAGSYIEAVLNGAIAAIDRALIKLPANARTQPYNASEQAAFDTS